jgi:hypothetical protein
VTQFSIQVTGLNMRRLAQELLRTRGRRIIEMHRPIRFGVNELMNKRIIGSANLVRRTFGDDPPLRNK